MTDRAALTTAYLGAVARHGATADDLTAAVRANDRLNTLYRCQYLSRPLFLGHAESEQLNADLQHVRTALVSLPDLLYGGDLAAFGQAAGLTDLQAAAVLRTRAQHVTHWGRADMYSQPDGLRLLEFNLGSGAGGSDNGDICQELLRHSLLREFARARRLDYPDTMHEQISRIFSECGFEPGSFPMIALVDWPDHFTSLSPYLDQICARWRPLGLDAHACHLGELKAGGGRVTLHGRPVDIIFRIFLIEHLLEPDGPALINPVIDAVARGEVAMFTPLDADLYGSKAPLAMLSDHANRHLFTPDQQAAFDRILPWTRMVRPGPVTLEDGGTVDLLEYAASDADNLVLKPGLMHGGLGVQPGWRPDLSAQQWRDLLRGAMDRPYVIQRRIRPTPELYPGEHGEPTPWLVVWGVFTSPAGFRGVLARGVPDRAGSDLVVNLAASREAAVGPCLVSGPGPQA
jgi:hypothetical protein